MEAIMFLRVITTRVFVKQAIRCCRFRKMIPENVKYPAKSQVDNQIFML